MKCRNFQQRMRREDSKRLADRPSAPEAWAYAREDGLRSRYDAMRNAYPQMYEGRMDFSGKCAGTYGGTIDEPPTPKPWWKFW